MLGIWSSQLGGWGGSLFVAWQRGHCSCSLCIGTVEWAQVFHHDLWMDLACHLWWRPGIHPRQQHGMCLQPSDHILLWILTNTAHRLSGQRLWGGGACHGGSRHQERGHQRAHRGWGIWSSAGKMSWLFDEFWWWYHLAWLQLHPIIQRRGNFGW